ATVTVSAPGATHVSISAPAGSTAGSTFGITVSVLDSSNSPVTGYTGTVHFTSSDGQALLPNDYLFTSGDAGVHTFANAVSLKTAGSQTVIAIDAANSSISGSAPVTVSAQATGATTEDFEYGLTFYHASGFYSPAKTVTYAAHDGSFGLDMPGST